MGVLPALPALKRPTLAHYPGDRYLEQVFRRVHGKVSALAEPPPGSGLKPEETVDVDRDASSIYLDLESNLTDKFQLGLAGRFEDYSDFGSSVNGKISGRYELTPAFAVRGTVGTGFRAPSLTQAFFRGSTTSFGEAYPIR